MALKVLNRVNIKEDQDNNVITNEYADKLREVIDELIENRVWGGININNHKEKPCGDCSIRVFYSSPRATGWDQYQDWVWIELLTDKSCNFWLHIDKKSKEKWAWSVWSNLKFQGSKHTNYHMPPNFTEDPVYKTDNQPGDLQIVFDEICREMPNLCNCYGM